MLRPTQVTANSRNMYKAHMGCARVNIWTALFLMNSMWARWRYSYGTTLCGVSGISGPCNPLYSLLSLPTLMSSMAPSSSSFQPILDAALINYRNQTKVDLTKHPSADKLQNSSSLDDILQLLLERESAFNVYRDKHRKLIDSLRPIVQAVHAFSTICGEAARLVRDQHDISLYLHILMPASRRHSSRQRRYSLELMFSSQ